jgi:hypothetical protein
MNLIYFSFFMSKTIPVISLHDSNSKKSLKNYIQFIIYIDVISIFVFSLHHPSWGVNVSEAIEMTAGKV